MSLPVKEPVVMLGRWARKEYDLTHVWKLIEAVHTPDLGYHNLNHLEIVSGAAVMLAMREHFSIRLTLIAAMFHDVGHTGMQPDTVNIRNALDWLNCWNEQDTSFQSPLNSDEFALVANAIRCTEYRDGDFPLAPATTLDKILRDADLWNPHLQYGNTYHMLFGLKHELDWQGEDIDWLNGQRKFFQQQTYYTEYGKQIAYRVDERFKQLCGCE